MRSVVDILLPLSEAPAPTFPPTDEEWDPTAVPDVKARLWSLSTGNTLAPSGQSNDTTDYLVQIPVNAMPNILVGEGGHRLKVKTNPEAPDIEGRVFRILGIQHGTEAWNRDLICREHTTQEQS